MLEQIRSSRGRPTRPRQNRPRFRPPLGCPEWAFLASEAPPRLPSSGMRRRPAPVSSCSGRRSTRSPLPRGGFSAAARNRSSSTYRECVCVAPDPIPRSRSLPAPPPHVSGPVRARNSKSPERLAGVPLRHLLAPLEPCPKPRGTPCQQSAHQLRIRPRQHQQIASSPPVLAQPSHHHCLRLFRGHGRNIAKRGEAGNKG